jgi:flagellar biosynthesis/type III secretory pathway chaperone
MTTINDPNSTFEQDILNSLATNLQLSEELLTALQEEETALKTMDTPGLFRLSRRKETLLVKIQYLDNALRKSLIGQSENPSTESQTPERTQVIGQYKIKIKAIRQKIHARNTLNKRFTEDTLGYLNDAIALITRPVEVENIYRAPGRAQARGKNMPSFISRQV